jgi:hypothetical protein
MTTSNIKIKNYKILEYEIDIKLDYTDNFEKGVIATMLFTDWYVYFPTINKTNIDSEIIATFENLIKYNIGEKNIKDFMNKYSKIYKTHLVFEMPGGELYIGEKYKL